MGGRGYRKLNKFKPFDANTICDETGFKKKVSEVVERWDGFRVIPEAWNPQQPQDFPPTITKPILFPESKAESSYPPLYVPTPDDPTNGLNPAWEAAGVTSAWLMWDTPGPDLLPTIGDNNLTGLGNLVYGVSVDGFDREGVNFSVANSGVSGVEADFNTNENSEFTFTGLVQTGSNISGIQRLCLVVGSSGASFNLDLENGLLRLQNYASGTLNSSFTLSANTVYKIAATMDQANGEINFYVNDSSDLNTGVSGINMDYGTLTAARIGSQDNLGNFQFYGVISCVAVSKSILTEAQIQAIFDSY